jgi:hypothetical protein
MSFLSFLFIPSIIFAVGAPVAVVPSASVSPDSGEVTVYVVDGGYLDNVFYKSAEVHDFTSDKGTDLEGLDCNRDWGAYHGNRVSSLIHKYSEGKAKIISLKALPCDGDYSNAFWNIFSALNYVANNHKSGTPAVVNMSMSTGRFSILLERPLAKLERLNIPVVVSAGNYGEDGCNYYSVKSKRTIAVGALNSNFKTIWEKSNTGSCVDYYAGGRHVCADFGDTVSKCNSTSFAAPVATALIVKYLADNPKAKVSQVREVLKKSSKGKKVTFKGKQMSIKYFPNPRGRL